MKKAADEISKFGPKFVLVKGGHLSKSNLATDILYDASSHNFYEFSSEMITSNNTHGTGTKMWLRECLCCVSIHIC